MEFLAPTLIPDDTMTRISVMILLSGYSINFIISSHEGDLTLDTCLPLGVLLEINSQ
jgi:hypothetical protein